MRDYYLILGINNDASEKAIKSAYRKLSQKFHPDKNDGDKFFEEHFKVIQEAYETLSDTNRRGNYDFKLATYKSRGANDELLKKSEQEFKRKFEEELAKREEEHRIREEENRKREEELKQTFKAREEQIRKEYEDRIKKETEATPPTPPTPSKPAKQKKRKFFYILSVSTCLIIGFIYFFYKIYKKEGDNNQTSIINSDTTNNPRKDTLVSLDIGVGIPLNELIETYFRPIKIVDQLNGFYESKISGFHYRYLNTLETNFNKQVYKLVLFEITDANKDPDDNYEISNCHACKGWLTIIRFKVENGNWVVDEFEPFPDCCEGDFGEAVIPQIKIFNSQYGILFNEGSSGNQGVFNSWLTICNLLDLTKCDHFYFKGGEVTNPDILSRKYDFILENSLPVLSFTDDQTNERKTLPLVKLFQYNSDKASQAPSGMKYVIDKDNLITEQGVGDISLGDTMPTEGKYGKYFAKWEERSRYTEEGDVIDTLLVYYLNARECFHLEKEYDYKREKYVNYIGEITIVSDDFRTKDNIGVNTTIEEFIAIFPKYKIWYTYISDMFVIQSDNSKVQYRLNNDDFLSTRYLDSEIETVKKSEFRENSKINRIRIY